MVSTAGVCNHPRYGSCYYAHLAEMSCQTPRAGDTYVVQHKFKLNLVRSKEDPGRVKSQNPSSETIGVRSLGTFRMGIAGPGLGEQKQCHVCGALILWLTSSNSQKDSGVRSSRLVTSGSWVSADPRSASDIPQRSPAIGDSIDPWSRRDLRWVAKWDYKKQSK
jgi:hypothetical protein